MASNSVAWFHTRLAMQLAKLGRHEEARSEYNVALSMYPRDYKAMAGLAKLASQEGRWQEAIEWGARSDGVAQMADVRALVGDAYAKVGDSAKAEEQYCRVAELVGRPSGMNDGLHEVTPAAGTHGHRLDRQYAIFCADHDRDPVGAYAAAVRDFEAR
jgi:tetratricopeptide (TPR) repeat protein